MITVQYSEIVYIIIHRHTLFKQSIEINTYLKCSKMAKIEIM